MDAWNAEIGTKAASFVEKAPLMQRLLLKLDPGSDQGSATGWPPEPPWQLLLDTSAWEVLTDDPIIDSQSTFAYFTIQFPVPSGLTGGSALLHRLSSLSGLQMSPVAELRFLLCHKNKGLERNAPKTFIDYFTSHAPPKIQLDSIKDDAENHFWAT